MIGIDQLLEDFRTAGLQPVGPIPCGPNGQNDFAVLRGLHVLAGRFSGQSVDVALLVPKDYPYTPPSGLYLNPQLLPATTLNVHLRAEEVAGLPSGSWLYWSRPIAGRWRQENRAQILLAHWQSVFADEAILNVPLSA